jgi:DNA primase
MEDIKISRNDIVKQVSIETVAAEFQIELESISAGNFDWRCKCPSEEHKHGMEKTSSLYINIKKNDFFCYGCNAGSSVIDFYMLCTKKDFASSFRDLKEFVKHPGKYKDSAIKKADNLQVLLHNSKIIREHLLSNNDGIHGMNEFLIKLDQNLFEVHKDEVEYVEKINKKLEKKLGC